MIGKRKRQLFLPASIRLASPPNDFSKDLANCRNLENSHNVECITLYVGKSV